MVFHRYWCEHCTYTRIYRKKTFSLSTTESRILCVFGSVLQWSANHTGGRTLIHHSVKSVKSSVIISCFSSLFRSASTRLGDLQCSFAFPNLADNRKRFWCIAELTKVPIRVKRKCSKYSYTASQCQSSLVLCEFKLCQLRRLFA